MYKFVLATLAGSAALLAATGASANDGEKAKVAAASSFASLDRNSDARISRSEAGFDRVLSQTFAEIDTDGDGFISPAEFAHAEQNSATVTNVSSR